MRRLKPQDEVSAMTSCKSSWVKTMVLTDRNGTNSNQGGSSESLMQQGFSGEVSEILEVKTKKPSYHMIPLYGLPIWGSHSLVVLRH